MPSIEILTAVIAFFILTKIMLFWLWLWQLKEYHLGRLKAHFETEKFKKIMSGFWRVKFPKFTKKIIVVVLYGLAFDLVMTVYLFLLMPGCLFYVCLLILIILSPVIFSLLVLLFQTPTIAWQNRLLQKAERKRERFKNLIVIGITGSYGKTSTKEFLAAVLAEKFNVLKTKKHINSEIGIAQTILKELKPEHQIFIAEIGAYERGKIKEVCQMLRPQFGILTGINEQHLSTFGSQENIIKGKFELIESLQEDGVAVLNGDNDFIKSKVKSQKSKPQVKSQKFCSTKERADIWTENIKVEKEEICFNVFTKDGEQADFRVNLIGRQNAQNLLLAACCAKELGTNLQEIALACRKIGPEQGSVQLKKGINGLNVIDATYSANPDGVLADLEYLKLWTGKKVIVMPCLIELGKAAKEVHQRIGDRVGRICDLAIITTRDYFQDLKDAAVQTGMAENNILLCEKSKKILEKIKDFCQKDDIVLLESRVPPKLAQRLLTYS